MRLPARPRAPHQAPAPRRGFPRLAAMIAMATSLRPPAPGPRQWPERAKQPSTMGCPGLRTKNFNLGSLGCGFSIKMTHNRATLPLAPRMPSPRARQINLKPPTTVGFSRRHPPRKHPPSRDQSPKINPPRLCKAAAIGRKPRKRRLMKCWSRFPTINRLAGVRLMRASHPSPRHRSKPSCRFMPRCCCRSWAWRFRPIPYISPRKRAGSRICLAMRPSKSPPRAGFPAKPRLPCRTGPNQRQRPDAAALS